MQVLPKKGNVQQRNPAVAAQYHTFPAPIRGVVLNQNLAMAQPGSAVVLDNWVCTSTGISVRGGSVKVATLPSAVVSMFSYSSGSIGKLFAATETDVYDVTSVADVDVTPAADISGQTSGYYSTQQFGTAGGDFLIAVNGSDHMQLFDGGTWEEITDTSTLAITGVDTSKLSHVWSYASRLFFVEKDKQKAWYLPSDSIAGEAHEISLSGVFQMGGSLLMGATWSLDSGSGLDDMCVFISTEGEVAVYKGTNPGDYANWSLSGVYQITPPLGQNATMRAGGDLLVATSVGLVPISSAISKDIGALSMASVSASIEPEWRNLTETYTLPWEIQKWPDLGVMVVAMANALDDRVSWVCNLNTGAWSRFTNIGIRCMAAMSGNMYAGGNDGVVKLLDASGSDIGIPYTSVYIGSYEAISGLSDEKTILQARAKFRATSDVSALVGMKVDYDETPSSAPSSISDFASALWDSGEWDVAKWDGGNTTKSVTGQWRSIGRTGTTVGPEVQITCGITSKPVIELVSVDMTYRKGAFVA